MTLAQLLVFMAVVEEGSFSGAADRLGKTQSGVSHVLADLERALSVTLLHRDRHGVRLTAVGERVMPFARELLALAERIRQEAAAARGMATGRLRVGCFPSVAARVLPGIVKACQSHFPGIELVLFEGTDAEVETWLEAGVVDVGFVTLPNTSFSTVPITSDALLAVAPQGHPAFQGQTARMSDLADEPFILSKGGCEPIIARVFRSADLALRPRFEVRDMQTLLAMVREGLGVALVPELALPQPLDGLTVRPLEQPAQRDLALAFHAREASAPAVLAFIEVARNQVTKEQGQTATYAPGTERGLTPGRSR